MPYVFRDDYQIVLAWRSKVTTAALAFEARWTEAALRRIDADLHARFLRQRDLFNKATEDGSPEEVATHGSAMCRGYAAVTAVMEKAGVPDDAYMIGRGPGGLTIAIGPKPCSADRVRELHGDQVPWFSPDEVAAIIEMDRRFKAIVDVKNKFPGASMSG